MSLRPGLVTSLIPLFVLAGPVPAQDQPQNQPPLAVQSNQIDARAMELLEAARKQIAETRVLAVDITHSFSVRGPNIRQQMETRFDFAMERPNRIALNLKEGLMGETIISDGEHLYRYMPTLNRYTKTEAPSNVRELFTENDIEGMDGGALDFIGPVLLTERIGGEAGTLMQAEYKGTEEVDGASLHRIALSFTSRGDDEARPDGAEGDEKVNDEAETDRPEQPREPLVLNLWLTEDDEPQVKRMQVDLTRLVQRATEHVEMPAHMRDMEYEMTISFRNWRFDPELPAERFVFTPPQGAQEVGSMMEAFGAGGGENGGQHALVGREAPEFELENLDGRTVSLAQHRDNIVVLDFWATWCGPCVRALPELISVTNEFRDRNVVFYAVNVREDSDKVRSFIEKREWNVNVLLDRDGSVAQKYHVRGIPQTVIIHRDGTVQAVHIGFGGNTKTQLQRELETLVEGRALVGGPDVDEGPD